MYFTACVNPRATQPGLRKGMSLPAATSQFVGDVAERGQSHSPHLDWPLEEGGVSCRANTSQDDRLLRWKSWARSLRYRALSVSADLGVSPRKWAGEHGAKRHRDKDLVGGGVKWTARRQIPSSSDRSRE